MSIRNRLFGPAWEHRDPAIRAQAVSSDEDPALREALPRIAEHDEDAGVRLAALERIDSEAFWLDARLRESDADIIAAADARLARAILHRGDERLLEARVEWLGRIDDPELIRSAARHAPDRAVRAEALSRIDAAGFLGDRIVDEADDALALSLAERIEQVSTLKRIATILRKQSKRRARAVENRLQTLQAEAGSFKQETATATGLVQRAEAMARGELGDDPAGELAGLREEWAAQAGAPEPLRRRFEGAIAIVERALSAPPPEPSAAATPDESEAPGPDAALRQLVDRLERTDDPVRHFGDRAGKILGDFDRCWNAIARPGAEDQALRERALPILRLLQKHRQEMDTAAEPPPSRPTAEEPDWDTALDEIAAQLEAGHLADAQAAVRELRTKLDRLAPKQRPRAVSGRLGRLEGRLREMRQWEHWSNNQARDELIARVEAMADADLHPDAISAALKEAREEWQRLESLEVLPGDKRRHAAPAGQWRRFQAACKQAFGQAQPYFEKRHEVQAENLEQLEAFLERGQAIADGEDSDIEAFRQTLKIARLAIRRLDDLPPKSRGKAAGRLRSLMNTLSARLDAAFERVETAKRGLIREAKALEHETDLKTAIDKSKALQARWKQAGTGRRKIEQQLWQEFRAPIDPLFDKLRGEQDQRREAQAEETAALRELVETAEQLAAIDADELDSAAGRMKALRADWEAAGRRPAGLVKRFEQAERNLDQRLDERSRAERRRALEQIEALAGAVQSAWQSLQAGAETLPELPDHDADDPASGALLDAYRKLADTNDDEALLRQTAENREQARQVLIEMEFLAGMESPPQDREARMSFQVERLAQRMAQRGSAPGLAEEMAALRARWYASFPHPVEEHDDMAKRYRKCQNVLESMSGTQ